MGLVGHGAPILTGIATASGHHPVEPEEPGQPDIQINWLFSGVLLGAGSWLLLLGGVLAWLGSWIVAGALFAGAGLCLVGIWRATRRLAGARQTASGRHREGPDRVEAA